MNRPLLLLMTLAFACSAPCIASAQDQELAPLKRMLFARDQVARNGIWLLPDGGLSPVPWTRPARGSVLPALYVSLIGLEAYDGYSTSRGLAHGATESNALLGRLASNQPALWAIKGATTVVSILVAERLWRAHRRGEAIVVMCASNAIMVGVALSNASVLRTQ